MKVSKLVIVMAVLVSSAVSYADVKYDSIETGSSRRADMQYSTKLDACSAAKEVVKKNAFHANYAVVKYDDCSCSSERRNNEEVWVCEVDAYVRAK